MKVKVFSSKNYNFKGSLKKIKDFKKVCVFVSESHACKCLQGPEEEGLGSHEMGLTGSFELPGMGAGN